MSARSLPFFSSGLRLDADLHLPEDGGDGAPYPVVIACSGYQGQKIIHPERLARALNPLDYAVLAFDYRGFGLSEGERGRLVPQEWVEDVRAGVDRLGGVEVVDASRLALVGWGLGGGVVVVEAADDARVKAVACLNGIGDGARAIRNMHDEESWERLLGRIEADRARRSALGRSELTSPWDIVRLDLDGPTDGYVNEELYKAPGFGGDVTLESADFFLRFCPERSVHRIAPRPLLIVHGAKNDLHKPIEAQSLYEH
ncbi:MAG: alpha/beta hydrolase, partial [Acidimicrobiales bacterium]